MKSTGIPAISFRGGLLCIPIKYHYRLVRAWKQRQIAHVERRDLCHDFDGDLTEVLNAPDIKGGLWRLDPTIPRTVMMTKICRASTHNGMFLPGHSSIIREVIMYLTKPSLVALAVAATLAGTVADADGLNANSPAAIEKSLRTFSGHIDVEYVHNRLTLNDRADGPLGIPDRSVDEIQRVRSAIRDNKALLGSLTEKGVAVRDVINAYQAADGSITFYVR